MTTSEVHPLLSGRTSPLSFDPSGEISYDQLGLLLEAARLAPSAGNSQPWGFVVARRGSPEHATVVRHLAPSSARWAPDAAALLVNLVHRHVAGTDWPFSEFAEYDLGQAVAYLTLQAHALGLACRQFRAFDLDGLTDALVIEDGWAVMTMTAVGHPANRASRSERRSVDELLEVARLKSPG